MTEVVERFHPSSLLASTPESSQRSSLLSLTGLLWGVSKRIPSLLCLFQLQWLSEMSNSWPFTPLNLPKDLTLLLQSSLPWATHRNQFPRLPSLPIIPQRSNSPLPCCFPFQRLPKEPDITISENTQEVWEGGGRIPQ